MVNTAQSQSMSSEELNELSVRCLLMPLHNAMLLLPNTLVAEVVEYRVLDRTANMPQWVRGTLPWRGKNVAVISFERLLGQEVAQSGEHRRYVVCNTLNGNPRLPFVALEVDGLPHLAMVKNEMLEHGDDAQEEREPAILARLRLNEESVIVPNIDVMEKMLEHLGLAAG